MSVGILRGVFFLLALFMVCTAKAQVSINELMAENRDVSNPDGTISDWAELYNDSTEALSLAGYSLTDSTDNPRRWVVPAGVTIPGKGYLFILLDSGRPASTTSASPLNAGFAVKASGDRLELYAPAGTLVESVRFGPQAANYSLGRLQPGQGSFVLCDPTPGGPNIAQELGSQSSLRINEWMADPVSGDDWFELYNPGDLPVQLSGLYFTDDNDEPSPVAPYSFIGHGRYGYLQIFADNSTNDNEVDFGLSAGGDSISLFFDSGSLIDSVEFDDQTEGVSQGRFPDGSTSVRSLNTASPGDSNMIRYTGLVVSELLAHTDPPLEDAVEFYNQTDQPIDISGWFLSDSSANLLKYRVPDGTIVPARGYIVFYEYQFNSEGDPNGFGFSSSEDDDVYLSQANASGELTGFIVWESFEASANGVSFGRHETSVPGDYKFVALESISFGSGPDPSSLEQFRSGTGAANTAPLVGPVVINEIMYHPPNASTNDVDNTIDEYLEIFNLSTSPVPLYDVAHPANRWRFQGGLSFDFPASTTLAASEYALIVSFDPSADPSQLAAFRSKYSVPNGVRIFGPYSGRLSNSNDEIELYRPDAPQTDGSDPGSVPYLRVDKVNYRDVSPWPSAADGSGASLQRSNSSAFGNDPAHWSAADPTAGRSNSGSPEDDTDSDGIPDSWEVLHGFNPADPSDASADFDSDSHSNLQEFLAGTDPRDPSDRLLLTGLSVSSQGLVSLSFASIPGRSYSVEYRAALAPGSPWLPLFSTNASASETIVTDSSGAERLRFYRVATPASE